MEELTRAVQYSLRFYFDRLGLIILFSMPFILSFMMLSLVSAPTYQAIGGLFSRTGSIPELSFSDIIIIVLAYIISFFIIADTITNINLIIRSKRTLTMASSEVFGAMGKYATRIFYIFTLMLLLIALVQLLLFDNPFKSWLFPIFSFVLSFFLFFVPPAVIIDEEDTPGAIRKSVSMALRKPWFIVLWSLIGLVSLSIVKILADFILPHSLSSYAVFLFNSLFLLPFLIILQTQMYMEKYPLAK